MSKIRLLIASLALTLETTHREIKRSSNSRGLSITNPNKKQVNKPKKSVKPKGKNYTSKMKAKPNTVRKDFNQRRR